jgi:hypothetical protein
MGFMRSLSERGTEMAFKKVENGYIYRAPWMSGPYRFYLTTEADKEAIKKRMVSLKSKTALIFFSVACLPSSGRSQCASPLWL